MCLGECVGCGAGCDPGHRLSPPQDMFEPYLKSFFVRSSDPTHIKSLKLEVGGGVGVGMSVGVYKFLNEVVGMNAECGCECL